MNTQSFCDLAEKEGFSVGEEISRPAGSENADHAHHFDARLLVLAGDITIGIDGTATTYQTGEVFEVAAGTMHTEKVGANGVTLLVGRR